ncbi:MAG: MBL fold metallo-hydrolase [Caldilineaceae bacterium]|nr:MBL fold metallo-hydrolase [Caldilineaceae bacterium]
MQEILPGFWQIDEIGDVVNCYLLEWDEGVTLIDTGTPGNAQVILDAVTSRGWAIHNVRRIIVTHMDVDHVGSLLPLQHATQASVACHAVEKTLLEHPRRRRPNQLWLWPLYWGATRLPQFRVQPVSPDEIWVEGHVTPEGLTVIHTPGHTPGHISLLHKEKRLLIAGDALSNRNGKLTPPPPPFTPDMQNAQRSIWKLAKKYGADFDAAVFGHGPAIRQNADKRVKGLVSQIFATEV